MKVQVAKWGNSTAVRLPKAVVKELGLTPGTMVDVSVENGKLSLIPETVQTVRELNRMPNPVTAEWLLAEAERLGGLANAPEDDWDWGRDMGSEVIYDDYNPVPNPEPGEVYWVDLDPAIGTEQAGRRPVMILSGMQLHAVSLRCLVCPITSNRSPWPTKIVLPEGCVVDGAILLDQVRMIDRKARRMRYIGKLPDEVVDLTSEALTAFLGRNRNEP